MEGMERISEAILDKVKKEARGIVREAEKKGKREIEKARERRERRLAEESGKMIQRAEMEATRIRSQASIAARQELLGAKTGVLDEIISRVKKAVSDVSSDGGLLSLIGEAVSGLGVDEVKIYVSSRDVATVNRLLKSDKELGPRVKEVRKINCTGGAVAESPDGRLRIDNTYDTRIEMLLPRILPEINKELFDSV